MDLLRDESDSSLSTLYRWLILGQFCERMTADSLTDIDTVDGQNRKLKTVNAISGFASYRYLWDTFYPARACDEAKRDAAYGRRSYRG